MSAPVIVPDQSVPGGKTWQAYFKQFYAENDPTSWTCSPIAPGLTLDSDLGRIIGTPTTAGESVFGVRAHNADGASDPVYFCMSVEQAAPLPPGGYLTTRIELTTGKVTFDGIADLLSVKRGDHLLQQLQFTRNGTVVDLTLSTLKLGIKLDETEECLVLGDSFLKVGSGEETVFLHYASLAGVTLPEALEGEEPIIEGDVGATEIAKRLTQFLGLAEFEMRWANDSGIGPNPATWTTRSFGIQVVRDLIP